MGVQPALFFIALLIAAVIAELFPVFKGFDAWLTDRQLPLALATGGAAVLGVFLLVGAVIAKLMEGGAPLDRTGVENQQRSMRDAQMAPQVWRASTYRLFGTLFAALVLYAIARTAWALARAT